MDQALATPVVSRHKCLVYEGHPSEQLTIVVPFLADGLSRRRMAVYLGPPEMVAMVGAALTGWGVHTAREIRDGNLRLSSDRSYLAGGRFDPIRMVDALRQLADQAIANGYEGVTASGDMMWELGSVENFARLLEYETLLDEAFEDLPFEGICQYRRGAVPLAAIQQALLTHRSAYIGTVLSRDNPFYAPPDLASDIAAAANGDRHGSWMCRQILKVEQARMESAGRLEAMESEARDQRRLVEHLSETNGHLEERLAERKAQVERLNAMLASQGKV